MAERAQPIATYREFLAALLSDRERFFEEVVESVALRAKLRHAVVTIVGLSGFFGLVAGAYSGLAQALSSAAKLPFLFFATFLVCFPAFFVVQVLVGSRLRLLQVIVLVCGSLALTSVLLAAFVPITLFFLVTGANYYFQHLLNIAIAGVAGLFGVYALHEGLSLVWAVLFAFVGIQLAWNLRPFLGDRNEPFRIVGSYQGNFYAAIIYAARQLLAGEQRPAAPAEPSEPPPRFRGLPVIPSDTAADTSGRPIRP